MSKYHTELLQINSELVIWPTWTELGKSIWSDAEEESVNTKSSHHLN